MFYANYIERINFSLTNDNIDLIIIGAGLSNVIKTKILRFIDKDYSNIEKIYNGKNKRYQTSINDRIHQRKSDYVEVDKYKKHEIAQNINRIANYIEIFDKRKRNII